MFTVSINTYSSSTQSQLNGLQIQYWNPAFSNETLLRDIQIEEIQGMIDRFYFPDFDEPILDVLCCCHQHSVSVILSLSQNLKDIFAFILYSIFI